MDCNSGTDNKSSANGESSDFSCSSHATVVNTFQPSHDSSNTLNEDIHKEDDGQFESIEKNPLCPGQDVSDKSHKNIHEDVSGESESFEANHSYSDENVDNKSDKSSLEDVSGLLESIEVHHSYLDHDVSDKSDKNSLEEDVSCQLQSVEDTGLHEDHDVGDKSGKKSYKDVSGQFESVEASHAYSNHDVNNKSDKNSHDDVSRQLESIEVHHSYSDHDVSDKLDKNNSEEVAGDIDSSQSDEVEFLCVAIPKHNVKKRSRYGLTGDEVVLNTNQGISRQKFIDKHYSEQKKTKYEIRKGETSKTSENSGDAEDVPFIPSDEMVNESTSSHSSSCSNLVGSAHVVNESDKSSLNSSRRMSLPYYQFTKPTLDEYVVQTNRNLCIASHRSSSGVKMCQPDVSKVGSPQNSSTGESNSSNQVEFQKKDDDDLLLIYDGPSTSLNEFKKKSLKQSENYSSSGSKRCDRIYASSTSSGEAISADRATWNESLKKKIDEKKAAAFKMSKEAMKLQEEDVESDFSECGSDSNEDDLCHTEPFSDSDNSDIQVIKVCKSKRPLCLKIDKSGQNSDEKSTAKNYEMDAFESIHSDETYDPSAKLSDDSSNKLEDEEVFSRKRKCVRRLQDDSDDNMEDSDCDSPLKIKNSGTSTHTLSVTKPVIQPSFPSSTTDSSDPSASKCFGSSPVPSDFISSSIPSYQPGGGFQNADDDEESQDSTSPESTKCDNSIESQTESHDFSSGIHYETLSSSLNTPVIGGMPKNESSVSQQRNFSHSSYTPRSYTPRLELELTDLPLTDESNAFASQDVADVCSGKFNSSSQQPSSISNFRKTESTSDVDVMPRNLPEETCKLDDDNAFVESVKLPSSSFKSTESQELNEDYLIVEEKKQDDALCSGEEYRDGSDDDVIDKKKKHGVQPETLFSREDYRHVKDGPEMECTKSAVIYDDVSDNDDSEEKDAATAKLFMAPATFIDAEAELSGEDSGDDDGAEPDESAHVIPALINDEMIEEEADESAKLYVKHMMDDDQQCLNDVKEKFLDGDLTSDGARRSRKFAWNTVSADTINNENVPESGSENEEDESYDNMNRERLKWKQDNMPQIQPNDDLMDFIKKPKMKMEVLGKAENEGKESNSLKRPRGSFLKGDDDGITRSLKKLKSSDESNGSRTTKHFVFLANKTDGGAVKQDATANLAPANESCYLKDSEKSIFNNM